MQNSKEKCSLTEQVIIYEVRTGNGKPGKSRNLRIQSLESHGILLSAMENHGNYYLLD